MTGRLNPHLLNTYIEQEELPDRSAVWPHDAAEKIIRYGSFVGSTIDHHRSLGRTMLFARNHIDHCERRGHSVENGTVILADMLNESKGRFARSWHAPAGGLWGSLIYISTLLPRYRNLVPLAVGVACCEAIRAEGAERAVIRWINDVLVDGGKVGGFLAESFTGDMSKETYCLLGFGINCNNTGFPHELRSTAVSLTERLGRRIDLEQFACRFLAKLCWNLGLLYYREEVELQADPGIPYEGEHPLIKRWCELSDSIGKEVIFGFDVMENPQYRATVTGITGDGSLRLLLEDGREVVENSGEIRYLDESA